MLRDPDRARGPGGLREWRACGGGAAETLYAVRLREKIRHNDAREACDARRWADAPQAVPKAGCRDVGRYGVPHIIHDEI